MGIINFLKNLNTNTLYFPGCLTKEVKKQEFENYKEIFNKLDIPYILLENEVCCGAIATQAGYKKEAKNLAEKNFKLFKEHNINKIITNCANCYNYYKNTYPNMIREWDIEIEHATTTILEALKKKRINLNKKPEEQEEIIYHDSCYLARHNNQTEEPRKIINLLGGKILEYKNNKEQTECCGANAGLLHNHPEEAKKIAEEKIKKAPNKHTKIISACINCHESLRRISERSTELSTYILQKLKQQRY